jgi:hypothetical protein
MKSLPQFEHRVIVFVGHSHRLGVRSGAGVPGAAARDVRLQPKHAPDTAGIPLVLNRQQAALAVEWRMGVW